MEKQYCPICKNPVQPSSRYPNYVCNECIGNATDGNGRNVAFHNTSLAGTGCKGIYAESGENYSSNICYIDNVECQAEEARFGGIVIRPTTK